MTDRALWWAGGLLAVAGVAQLYRGQRAIQRAQLLAAASVREANRPDSPRRGGIPRGMIPPRPHWTWRRFRCGPGIGVSARRTPFAEVADLFAGDALVHKWIDRQYAVCAFGHGIALTHWMEREAGHR